MNYLHLHNHIKASQSSPFLKMKEFNLTEIKNITQGRAAGEVAATNKQTHGTAAQSRG